MPSQARRSLPRFRSTTTPPFRSSRHRAQQRTGPALRSKLVRAPRSKFPVCSPLSDTPLPRNGAMRPRLLSSAPRGDPHRTRHGDSQRATQDSPDGEHAALCSTPRGTTIQGHPSARESAATCRQVSAGGKSRRATGTAPKRERRDVILSKGVWKSIRGDTGQLKETGRRGRTV